MDNLYMRSEELRKQDLLKLIDGLDISPSMYKNATEKYKAVGTYLQEQGLICDIFPQGSFSIGTVVRPYNKYKDVNYDLDFICCIDEEKSFTSPEHIKNVVKDTLCGSNVYKDKLQKTEWDKCWTLEYSDIGSVGFNMDIVPAVSESDDIILSMINPNLSADQAALAVAITNKNGSDYTWATSNPKAYKNWFQAINKPFLEYAILNQRRILFENASANNIIEEIPEDLNRSPLQRVIQILKHHRDVHFSVIGKENLKPASVIITTLCAEIAKKLDSALTTFELLQEIVNDLEIYSQHQTLTEDMFFMKFSGKKVISKTDGMWKIINPVNPNDNLADSWIETQKKAEYFFNWVQKLKNDYINTIKESDNDFIAVLENNFGKDYVKKNIDISEYHTSAPINIINTPKPWSE